VLFVLPVQKVMVLSKGKAVYLGPASKALEYFKSHGHKMPNAVNPADFLLEISNPDFGNDKKGVDRLIEAWEKRTKQSDVKEVLNSETDNESIYSGFCGAPLKASFLWQVLRFQETPPETFLSPVFRCFQKTIIVCDFGWRYCVRSGCYAAGIPNPTVATLGPTLAGNNRNALFQTLQDDELDFDVFFSVFADHAGFHVDTGRCCTP
jgi:hypothetical protein